MADRLNPSFTLKIDNEDGTPFARVTFEYFGVPYAQVVQMEGVLMGAVAQLHQWGQEKAKAA